MIADWPCPAAGGIRHERALVFDRNRTARLLVVPPLFEEANRTRRLLMGAMRQLDDAGIDSLLPDLPGCLESTAPFGEQDLDTWRAAMATAAAHFGATHVFSLRGGALVAPTHLPRWLLEPVAGAALLRQLLRARSIAAKEAGRVENGAALLEIGRAEGLELAGYRCGAGLIRHLEAATVSENSGTAIIRQAELGGGALWLRSEPADDPAQSAALAALLAAGIAG
ncbi:hypothetical protein [Novosphingobium lentum]|uniref:hypothetical protein n=1 Tax=Novosphingobium lentum TaxID=145287 RepID=UPI000AF2C250|nr:hypothetical protein [Novosphingobium lentum]